MAVSKECKDKGLAFMDILYDIDGMFDALVTFKPDYDLARYHLGEGKDDVRMFLRRKLVTEGEANEIGGLISDLEKVLGAVAQHDAVVKLRQRTIELMFQSIVACECEKRREPALERAELERRIIPKPEIRFRKM